MTTTLQNKRQELVARATSVGKKLAAHTERHDRDGTFVDEGVEALRGAGLLSIAVPEELGGSGATVADVAAVQRELARYCGSTALATSMHQHVTTFTAWRFRRELPGAEATLKRVVDDGIILVSTGGADFTHPRGDAVAVEGGFKVSGHKVFASLSPVGNVLSTMFRYDDPEQGPRVLNVPVPIGEGVQVLETWDAMGMRGTGSHEIVIEDVFVPQEKVLANRPHGVIDPPLQVILSIAMPIISAVYLGVAEGAYEAAVASAASKATDPGIQRQVGLMASRLRVASWSLDGALAMVGDDPQPAADTLDAVLAAKREVGEAVVEVCDLAMEVAGGAAFLKGSVIERAYRDVRGLKLHPLSPEQSLIHAGRLALGQPVDRV